MALCAFFVVALQPTMAAAQQIPTSDFSDVIHVDANGPNDPGPGDPNIGDPQENGTLNHPFDTIQEGIDAALDNYLVAVYPGVYTEAIDFKGKAITVRSAEDAAVIQAGGDYAVSFYTAEQADSVLANFVIANSDLGILVSAADPTITNVTVVNNDFGIAAYVGAEPNIVNCIFWYNAGGDLYGCSARYSCIESPSSGEGNIGADPCFADPNGGDYHLKSRRGRYWPRHDVWVLDDVTSPCIDTGEPGTQMADEKTPHGGRINMGAYGGTEWASLSDAPSADMNGDGVVNLFDFAVVADEWLKHTRPF